MEQVVNKKVQTKLNAIYNLASHANTPTEESDTAKRKLEELCQKYKIRLADYIADAKGTPYDFDFRDEEIKKAEQEATSKPKSERKRGATSRRSLIIEMAKTGQYSIHEMAKAVTNDTYPDEKENRKAVSGTLYDMKKNKGWVVGENTEGKVEIKIETKPA